MTTKTLKKLDDLNQKIEALKSEKEKIQKELETDLVSVLKHTNAFQVDFHTLVGGLLHCLDKAKTNQQLAKEWQEAGQKFCKTRLQSKPKKTKSSAPTDQKAA